MPNELSVEYSPDHYRTWWNYQVTHGGLDNFDPSIWANERDGLFNLLWRIEGVMFGISNPIAFLQDIRGIFDEKNLSLLKDIAGNYVQDVLYPVAKLINNESIGMIYIKDNNLYFRRGYYLCSSQQMTYVFSNAVIIDTGVDDTKPSLKIDSNKVIWVFYKKGTQQTKISNDFGETFDIFSIDNNLTNAFTAHKLEMMQDGWSDTFAVTAESTKMTLRKAGTTVSGIVNPSGDIIILDGSTPDKKVEDQYVGLHSRHPITGQQFIAYLSGIDADIVDILYSRDEGINWIRPKV